MLTASLIAGEEARRFRKVESATLDPEVAAKPRATGPDWPARSCAGL